MNSSLDSKNYIILFNTKSKKISRPINLNLLEQNILDSIYEDLNDKKLVCVKSNIKPNNSICYLKLEKLYYSFYSINQINYNNVILSDLELEFLNQNLRKSQKIKIYNSISSL